MMHIGFEQGDFVEFPYMEGQQVGRVENVHATNENGMSSWCIEVLIENGNRAEFAPHEIEVITDPVDIRMFGAYFKAFDRNDRNGGGQASNQHADRDASFDSVENVMVLFCLAVSLLGFILIV